MKVNFTTANTVELRTMHVGQAFLADRKSEKARGLYMIIDKKSGLMKNGEYTSSVFAVNLETGQLREFPILSKVEPANVEIFFMKN